MSRTTIGKYIELELIGQGGMAEVYVGVDPNLNRKVAIKLILAQFAEKSDFEARFQREAKTIAGLRHGNIIQIHEYSIEDGTPFMVMEYLDGGTLDDLLTKYKTKARPMPLEEVANILDKVAAGLDYAHKRGLIHRDIKPSNILFSEDGEPIIADFGIVKLLDESVVLTQSGGVIGSPRYLPPEQASQKEIDKRSDIYSLGVVLYQMVTGEVPFDGDVLSVLMQHVNNPPKNPITINAKLAENTANVILKALEKDPNDRYDDVGEMAKEFRISLTDTTSQAETIAPEPKEIFITKHQAEPKSKKEMTSSKPVSAKMIGGVVGFIVIAVAAYMAIGGGLDEAAEDTSPLINTQASAGSSTDPDLIVNPVSLPLQPVGMPFTDPVFGTTLLRVSDISDDGGFETQVYSQLQAFSSDNQYVLLDGSNGFVIRKLEDLSLVTGLDTSGWNDPRWHPVQSHVIVHYDSNEDTAVALQFTDIDTLTTTTIFTLPAQYQYIRVSQSFDEISEDGRWLSGLLTRNDGVAVIFALDMKNSTLGAELPIPDFYASACEPGPDWGEVEPDWIGVSPLGRYLVVQWPRDWSPDTSTPRCSGLETFDLQTGAFIGRVSPHHNHGDLGVDSDGVSEFFMTTELSSPEDNNRPAIAMRALPGSDTVSPPVYLLVVDWADEDHISCQGPHGVCLISWGIFEGIHDFSFENELFLLYTNGSVLRLTHHRSSKCGYWAQPRASISRDGRYVIFASDWGQETGIDSCGSGNDLGLSDPYIIDLGSD